MAPTFFATQLNFRKWLEKNHLKKTELLVGFYKVGSWRLSITWPQSVDEALCFGWIDGVRKYLDEDSYTIRFTPRKATSIWSAINIKKVEELIKQGRMQPAGIASYQKRTENKSRIYSYENEPATLSATHEKKFRANKKAWAFFIAQAPSYQKVIIHHIVSAKQPATQVRRLDKAISESEKHKRLL